MSAGERVGLDWSLARPAASAIVAAGYEFVVRYVSPLGSHGVPGQPNPKDVTADELAALVGAGLGVGLVFESYANRALSGSTGGREDGQTAAARAAQVGYPLGCVMWWAVDFPAPAAALSTVAAYGEGFAAGWGGPEHGPYGSSSVIDYCAEVARFPWSWQTMAWSGGVVSRNAAVLQRVGHYHPIPVGLQAVDVDEDVLLIPTVPFHRAGVVPTPPRPAPSPPAPAPAPAFDAARWVIDWRAVRGDTGPAFELLQRWGNATFPAYCSISPVAPSYGPQTAAFLREFAHRCGIPSADGTNIGPKIAGALVAQGFPAYLARAGFRG